MTNNESIAKALLDIQAVGFIPHQPITFKSGLLSPVYVDNRRLIFHPAQWRTVIEAMRNYVSTQGLTFDVIAGIESAGIPHSSALSYLLEKPSVFVRKAAKAHGTQSRVEGGDVSGKRILLIEDLVTTGSSSLAGVEALRESGAIVEDCLCICTYGFAMAESAFRVMGVRLHPLIPFTTIARTAQQSGYFGESELAIIEDWLQDPHGWATRQGLDQ